MFICLPEHRVKNKLLELKHPVSDSGGHWSMVVKENLRPMFTATLIPDGADQTEEVTLVVADALWLWNFSQVASASLVSSLDCIAFVAGVRTWKFRSVMEVWTVKGHEQLSAYLRFRDEPEALFDAYTLGRQLFEDVEDKRLLINIRPMPQRGEHIDSSATTCHKGSSPPSKGQQHVQVC